MIESVLINGENLMTTIDGGQVTGASFTISRTQVTNLTIVVADSLQLGLTARITDLLSEDATITWGDWALRPTAIKTGEQDGMPVVEIVCTSLPVSRLDKQTGGKNWGSTDVSVWATEIITGTGAKPYVQPRLGDREIEREEPQGDHQEPETTWDVLAEMSKQVGAWLFEDEDRIVLARPSWLVEQPSTRQIEVEWNTWADHTDALMSAPVYELDWDKRTWDGREQLTLSLLDYADNGAAHQARPGDILRYTGAAAPKDPVWIITNVTIPAHFTDPVQITAWRPVDPPEIIPESAESGGEGTAGVPTGPLGQYGWAGEQLVNASEIVKEGQRRKLPTLAIELAVACAMGESSLRNIGYGDAAGPDSLGLFQQRSTGWGSRSDRLTPSKAAGAFLEALTAQPYKSNYENGAQSLPASNIGAVYIGPGGSANAASVTIHRVQVNADPYHYAKFWSDARIVVKECIAAGESSSGSGGKASGPLGVRIDQIMSDLEGKYIDVDGSYGAQCVDSASAYIKRLTGIPMIRGNGKDYHRHPDLMSKFQPIDGFKDPRKGDIVTWGAYAFGSLYGGYGHVAVYSHSKGGTHYFQSQNPNPNRTIPLSTSGVVGLMRPRG